MLCAGLFFGGFFGPRKMRWGKPNSCKAASGAMRGSLLRDPFTETRAKLLCLYNKQHAFGWRGATNGFYFAHTVRTQRIEPHTILCGNQVLCQLRLQEYHVLSG